MANPCGCGCGEYLPEGSTREFKRGHKDRITNPDTSFAETSLEDMPGAMSIEELAAITPDDAEPKDAPEFKVKTAVKITATVRKDIEGKVAFMLGMSGQMWAMLDPVCGTAMLDNSDNVARKLTPIICQSPEVVRWFTKSGTFILWVNLAVALWPVLGVIFAHHIAKSVGATLPGSNGQAAPEPNAYVVQ